MSLEAGQGNPSPVVNGFLGLAVQLVTWKDVINGDISHKGWFSITAFVLFVHFFPFKSPKACLSMQST